MPALDLTLFQLTVEGVSDALHVARFEGVEEMSALYAFTVTVMSENRELPLGSMVGMPAVLELAAADQASPRLVHGIVCDVEQGAEGKRMATYRITIVPEMWRLDQRQDFRIFQALTSPEIIDKVMAAANLQCSKVESRLEGSYRTHEYRVQYRESDWAFCLRLMEEEGIFCFFEHTSSGHTLVLADSLSAYSVIAGDTTVRFRADDGALVSGEHVSRFNYREGVRPGKVTLRDYNFEKPHLNLESQAEGAKDAAIEVYDYPGEYAQPGEGSGLAKLRLESMEAGRRVSHGDSGCTRFMVGHTFQLAEHPRGDLNRGWLFTRVRHEGKQPVGEHGDLAMDYVSTFAAMPDDTIYRPPQRTPKPKIQGVQTAIVVGPGGEEIYPDQHGRVKVQFHWDRLGKKDEKSSCWIRVSQVWAGAGWGAMQIPRIGQEVVVDFLEGDPDRPLIVGRVYHGTNVPPYRLPAEKTKSTIKSDTSLGGGGFNELMFEDQKGSEEIYLHGQKDWTIRIENDKRQSIGHDETLEVGNDRKKEVKHDQSEVIGHDKSIQVGGQHTETIALTESITVGLASTHKVGGALSETVGAAKTSKVGGFLSEDVGANKKVNVGGKLDQSIGGDMKEGIGGAAEITITGKHQLTVEKAQVVKVGENADEDVGKVKSTNAGDKYSLVVGDGKVTVLKNGDITIEGKKIVIKGSGPIEMQGQKVQVKSDGTVDVKASGAVKVKGSSVAIN